HPESQRRGRLGTPAEVVLRMLVLKHLHDWSFDECEREVRGSLVYRAFCRIDGERVPDAKTLIRLAHVLDEAVLKELLVQLVARGRERRVIQGRRLRVDTTVVEPNIHYPTDATLLGDGVRVLTRTLRRLGEQVRKRTRAVGRRVFEIAQRSRTAGPRVSSKVRAQSKARMKRLYQELLGIPAPSCAKPKVCCRDIASPRRSGPLSICSGVSSRRPAPGSSAAIHAFQARWSVSSNRTLRSSARASWLSRPSSAGS